MTGHRLFRRAVSGVLDGPDIEVHTRLRECAKLEQENAQLRGRVVALEREIGQWKDYSNVGEGRLKEQLVAARAEVAKAVKDSELQATVLAAKDRELAEAEARIAAMRTTQAGPSGPAVVDEPKAPEPADTIATTAASTPRGAPEEAARSAAVEERAAQLAEELAEAQAAFSELGESERSLQDEFARVRETNRMLAVQAEEKAKQVRDRGREITALSAEVARLKREDELRTLRVAEERKRLMEERERLARRAARGEQEKPRAEPAPSRERRSDERQAEAARRAEAAAAKAQRRADAAEEQRDSAERRADAAGEKLSAAAAALAEATAARDGDAAEAAAERETAARALAESEAQVLALQRVLAREDRNAELHRERGVRERDGRARVRRADTQVTAERDEEAFSALRAEAQAACAAQEALRAELQEARAAAADAESAREGAARAEAAAVETLRAELDASAQEAAWAATGEAAEAAAALALRRDLRAAEAGWVPPPPPGPSAGPAREPGPAHEGLAELQQQVRVLETELRRADRALSTAASAGASPARGAARPPESVAGSATPDWEPFARGGGLVLYGPSGSAPCTPEPADVRSDSPDAARVRTALAHRLVEAQALDRALSRFRPSPRDGPAGTGAPEELANAGTTTAAIDFGGDEDEDDLVSAFLARC